jgi:imidazolonepropionase-like amidohydrolase
LVAYTGATLYDGTLRDPIADAVLVVQGDRVLAAGSRAKVSIPQAARQVHLKDRWIIPGLIDAHVHFFQSGGLFTRPDALDLRSVRPYSEELTLIRQNLLQTFVRYVASGVTSVVDVGGPMWNFEVRARARETLLAPRVAVAGPLVSTYAPPQLASPDPAIIQVKDEEEAIDLVLAQLEQEPDLIKIWFIHRRGDDLEEQSLLVEAAIAEAHDAGVRVAVHATELEVARAAVQAGADILVHSVGDRLVDQEFIQLLLEKEVVYTTTLVVNEGYEEVFSGSVRLTDVEQELADPEVIATFEQLWELAPGVRPRHLRRRPMRTPNPAPLQNLRALQDAGVIIAAGTDAGNIGTLHGPALHREFELMAQAGLTPKEILHAATHGAARAMAAEPEVGTLEPGMLADFVVLSADPFENIVHARRIEAVTKSGVLFTAEELRAAIEAPPGESLRNSDPPQ